MRTTTSAAALLAAALPLSYGYSFPKLETRGYSTTPQNESCKSITADEIRSMGNNTLFTRWRPTSHFIAPAGWMNDPCGFMYDPVRDEYHGYYQSHTNHINWGNISWGGAKSKDLIHWEDIGGWENDEYLALAPSGNGSYDGLGIFSGTAQPINIKGEQDGTLLIFYTSVSYLPTNWQLYYAPYTETQSLALSHDGGETWENYEGNPIITSTTNQPPMNWNVTGFRDPFFELIPELDEILEVDEPHYYAVFGSGIKGTDGYVGPRMPLWSAPANDLTNWTFLGALWEPIGNTSVGPVLSTGSYGYNFEVSGFFPLKDRAGNDHWYVNMGTEGGNTTFHPSLQWSLWNEGSMVRRENGSAEFVPLTGGAGDWGVGYALTSFNDTKNNRRVQYAWLREAFVGDGGLFSANQAGFQGALSLPRELFVHEVDDVTNTTELTEARTAIVENGTARTLGVRPLDDVVEGLRNGSTYYAYSADTYNESTILSRIATSHMELKTTVTNFTGPFGLTVVASLDGQEYTTIMYEPSNNTILVERLHSSSIEEFDNSTITGYFQPYTLLTTNQTEAITFDVFIDGSIVEIYINERFALSARVYPSKNCSTGFGVYVGENSTAEFETVHAWVDTANVWPQRPVNSSSQLVFDTPEQTNNYTWWAGN